jgi:hypothetical protein
METKEMMRKKIEFLDRLFKLLKCRQEILEFLKAEKLITDDTMQLILHDHHQTHSTKVAVLLEELLQQDKLQLADYEWTLLPHELMKLTLVSQSARKEFVYSV